MAIGYFLGGIAALLYTAMMVYFGVIKKSPSFIKLVKMKISKKMSDETAVKVCIGFSIFTFALSIFLFVFGAIQG